MMLFQEHYRMQYRREFTYLSNVILYDSYNQHFKRFAYTQLEQIRD